LPAVGAYQAKSMRILVTLWQHRELVWNLVKRELKTRYKASVLGFVWSVAKPLLLTLVLLIVFSFIVPFRLRNPGLPFVLHLLAGVLAWTFFAGALMESLFSILANANLIKKVQVAAAVFPAATVLSNLVHFLLALVVLFAFMIGFRVPFTPYLILLPIGIVLQTLLIFSLALLVSALNVFYRDVTSITEVALNLWFYVTPIFYALYHVQDKVAERYSNGLFLLYFFYLWNPMTSIVVFYRRVLYHAVLTPTEFDDVSLTYFLIIAGCLIALLFLVASKVFQHYSRSFADEL
jgi:ABC-type polysaccharide/polyol phosphate export permease